MGVDGCMSEWVWMGVGWMYGRVWVGVEMGTDGCMIRWVCVVVRLGVGGYADGCMWLYK